MLEQMIIRCTIGSALVGVKRASGMIGEANNLMERVFRKYDYNQANWLQHIRNAAFDRNCCEIIHLGFSPYEILLGCWPSRSLELRFLTYNCQQAAS